MAVEVAATEGVNQASLARAVNRAGAAQRRAVAVACGGFSQQGFADLRELVYVLVAVDKGGRTPGHVFKAVKLAADEVAQGGGVKAAQPGAGEGLFEAATNGGVFARGEGGEVEMQAEFASAGVKAGEGFARQFAEAHQAGGVDAARFGEAADGFVDGGREAEVVDVEGDFFHAGWMLWWGGQW